MRILTKEEFAAKLDGVECLWQLPASAPVYRQAKSSGLVILFVAAEDNPGFMRIFMRGALTHGSECLPSLAEMTIRVSEAGFLPSWQSMVVEFGFEDSDDTEAIYDEYFKQRSSTAELTVYPDTAGAVRFEIVAPQAVFAVREGNETVSYGLVIRKNDLNRPVPRVRRI